MLSELFPTHTPILDRQVPLPAPASAEVDVSVGSMLAVIVVSAVLIAAVAFFGLPQFFWEWWRGAMAALRGPWSSGRVLATAAAGLGAIFATIVVHEGGHLLGGLAVGFRYHSVRVGPFQFDQRFALTLDRKSSSLFTGMVFVVPVATRELRRRGFVMVAAGPLANLLAGCLVYALPFAGVFWSLFLFASIATGLGELIPLRSAIGWSDGKILANFFRSPAWSERHLVLMKLRADFVNGTPPEELSPELVAKAVAIRDASAETITAHSIAYANAYHRNDLDDAARMLEVCLAHLDRASPEVREALISDAAVFHAEKRGNPPLARQWLEMLPSTSRRWIVLRVEAAILEAEGNIEIALGKLKQCRAEADALPAGPQRTWLLGILDKWEGRLTGRQ